MKQFSLVVFVFILGWIIGVGCKEVPHEEFVEKELDGTAQLILGKWIFDDEDFEFWMFFDEDKVYGDGYEEGFPYRIEGNALITVAYGYETESIIVSINEDELILDTEGAIVTWTKSL
jgi:hypothetical protein